MTALKDLLQAIKKSNQCMHELRKNGGFMRLAEIENTRLEITCNHHSGDCGSNEEGHAIAIIEQDNRKDVYSTSTVITFSRIEDSANEGIITSYMDLFDAAMRKIKAISRSRSLDVALASQNPEFLRPYEWYFRRFFSPAFEAKTGISLKKIAMFADLEELAVSVSQADYYMGIVDINLEPQILETAKDMQFFRIFQRIPGYTHPATRFKKKNPNGRIALAVDSIKYQLQKRIIFDYAGYDEVARRVFDSKPQNISL